MDLKGPFHSPPSPPQPIYINFVREPVQRIISWYYYIRAPWYHFKYNENRTKFVGEAWKSNALLFFF